MSNDAIRQMFEDILEIEESMDSMYTELLSGIKNENITRSIAIILNDEQKHEKNVKEILDIIE